MNVRRLSRLIAGVAARSEEHTSELQSRPHLVCRLLLEKKNKSKLAEGFDERRFPDTARTGDTKANRLAAGRQQVLEQAFGGSTPSGALRFDQRDRPRTG